MVRNMPYFDYYERRVRKEEQRKEEQRRQVELTDRNNKLRSISEGLHKLKHALEQARVDMRHDLWDRRDRRKKEDEMVWKKFWADDAKRRAERKNAQELFEEKTEEVVSTREEEMKNEEGARVAEVVNGDEVLVVDEIVPIDETFVAGQVESNVERVESVVEETIAEVHEYVEETDGEHSLKLLVEKIAENEVVCTPSPTACSSSILSSVQVYVDHPREEDTGLLDTSNAAPILLLVSRDLDHIDGKPKHIFIDPFVAHVDAYPSLSCYEYIVTVPSFIDNIKPRDCSFVPLVKLGSSCQRSIALKSCIHFVFDPGILLKIVVVCSRVVWDSEFYDILLIRGRILSNREGMM